MSQVRMRHADVENEITVAKEAVPFHAASGWEVVEDGPRDEVEDDKADGGEPDGKAKGERPRASLATKKKEQD